MNVEKQIKVVTIPLSDSISNEKSSDENLSLKERLKHFTLAWYASTMSTGGIAFTLSIIPDHWGFLVTAGRSMFILNLTLFTAVNVTMCTRFIIHPSTFKRAFTNPHEGFFFATFWLTLATLLSNTTAYGVPNAGHWLITALRVAFWVYTFCTTLVAIFYYYMLFSVRKLILTNALPGWLLPIFPAMLIGTLASAISKTQPSDHAIPMLIAGLAYQNLVIFIAFMMYALYFGRLLSSGLPPDASRPVMFIAVGPPSFTALAFIGMAQDISIDNNFPTFTILDGVQNQAVIADVLSILALVAAISLWMLAFWFFAIALIAVVEAVPRNDFHLNWYACVFPNVGFTIATVKIGERLGSNVINQIGTVMALSLTFLWMVIAFCHIKAVIYRRICWPGKDEDAAH